MAIAVEVDELEVRVAQAAVQARGERTEGLPPLSLVVFVQAGRGAFQDDDVRLSVARQVHEFGAAGQRDIGFECNRFEWGELRLHDLATVWPQVWDRAQVALVEPSAGLLAQD